MATYDVASDALELIHEAARCNNNAWSTIQRIKAIRDKLAAMSGPNQDVVRTAIEAQGFDAAEIEAILARWNQIHAACLVQNVTDVKSPR
jgi:hypothetical protein